MDACTCETCEECRYQRRLQRARRRAALKRVGPDHVEDELARINAECERRQELSDQRKAQYEAYLAKRQAS